MMKRFLSLAAVKTKTMKTNYSNLGGYSECTDGLSTSMNLPKTIEIVSKMKSSRRKQSTSSFFQYSAKFIGFLALCVALLQGVAFGQVSGYTFTSTTETFAPLSGGTVINTTAGLSASMSTNADDGAVLVTLPFTFAYNGATYTQATMCTNGWVGLGNQTGVTAAQGRATANLFTNTLPNNYLAAWLGDGSANFPSPNPGSMRHGTSATGVYTFEWNQVTGNGFTAGTTILITYQVRLYGPTSSDPGRIEFLYGPRVGTPSTSRAIGIAGTATDYKNAVTGNSTATTLATAFPAANTKYVFVPPTPACPITPSPAIAATGVAQTATLSWAAAAGATSYEVYLGTTSGALTLQSPNPTTNSFTPATTLNASTTYYWRVVPINIYGRKPTGCTEWSFTTQAAVPTLSCTALTAFGNVCVNSTTAANSFTVTGINLTGDLTVNALAGYTYSTTAGGTYTSTLTLPQTGGSVSQTVFVKFTPTSAASFAGNISVSGGGATSQNVAASGTGVNTTITTNPSASAASYCNAGTATALTVAVSAATGSSFAYQWYSNTTASTVGGTTVGTNAASYTPLTTGASPLYYYCVVSGCGTSNATSTVSGAISIVTCISMPASGSTVACNANFYDSGGPSAQYGASENRTYTIYPSNTSCELVRATFSVFSTEAAWDGLMIYNGNSISSPLISSGLAVGSGTASPAGSWRGTLSPGTITSSASDGSLTFVFTSDGSGFGDFQAALSCIPRPVPAQPSVITGSLTPDIASTQTYSVTNVSGVSYAWTVPSGWVINSGQGTNSISVTVGTTNGVIEVTPSNCSGNGPVRNVTTVIPDYRWKVVSSSTGGATWAGGESRAVSITLMNNGILGWNSGVTTNVGLKWNTWTDYHLRVTAGTLAPGATQTYNFTIEAKNELTTSTVYGANLADGTYSLLFDVVNEGCFWFASNPGATNCPGSTPVTCSGNTAHTVPTQNVSSVPTLAVGTMTSFGTKCVGTTNGPNSFTVSGVNLTNDVVINTLSGYTYSTTSGGTYTSTLTLTPSSGALAQTVYVKFSPTSAISYAGNISVSSTGATSLNVAAAGTGTTTGPTITTATVSPTSVCSGSSVNVAATSIASTSGTAVLGAGGTTGSGSGTPFYHLWGGSKTQYIITASELSSLGFVPGNITSIGLNVVTVGTASLGGFAINAGLTTQANYSAGTAITTGLTQVYTGPGGGGAQTLTTGLMTFNFTTPINWNGTSNLVIQFCWSNANTGGTSTSITYDAPTNMGMYIYADSQTAAAMCSAATGPVGGSGGSSFGSLRPKFTIGGQIGTNVTSSYTWSWNTSPVINTATGSTTVTNGTSSPVTSTYNVTALDAATGCTTTMATNSFVVNPVPAVPNATSSTQCGPGIPTAYLTTGNAQSSPVYNWYSAASGGTAINTMTTYYNNSFNVDLAGGTIYGDANLNTGSGFLRLTSNTASMAGGLSIPAIGVNANSYQFGFDLTTPSGGADGMSFNFGDDVDASSTTPTAEAGSGTKLSVTFDIYDAAGTATIGQGIRVKYNGVELAYNSTNLAWIGTAFAPILIDINSAGQISVTAGGVAVITNLQLPPAYLAANKSTWSFAYKARTGGVFGVHRIDNVLIKYLPIPNDTYPNSLSSTTTFYVSESVGACEGPRTPITVTVLSATPPAAPTVTSTPTINVGGTSTYTATGVVGGTISWYSSALGGAALGTGTTFTTPTQCTPGTNITYYASDNDGVCVSTTRGSAITAVRPLITTDPANALICTTGGNVVLSANVTGGSSIAWSPGTNLTSTTALVTTASPTTTTQYTFNANVAGCSAQNGTVNVGVIAGAAFTPTATPAALCEGGTSVLASNLASSGFTVTPITTSMSTAPGTAVTLASGGIANVAQTTASLDDGGWASIPLGFNYNFFGSNYTTVNVGTNGTIMFGTYNGNGGFTSPYGLADYSFTTLPTTAEPLNVIAAAASDYHYGNVNSSVAGQYGSLKYWTEGIAPTRTFVVSYTNVNQFSTGPGTTTAQIKLFETTGIVEIHIPSSTSTNTKITGLQNSDASIGNIAQSTTATITNQAWRFVPGAAYTFQWSVGGSDVSGATSTSYTTPTLSTPGSVVYTCAATNPLTQCASKQPVTITVNPKPTAPVSGGDVTACSNITPQTLSVTAPAGCTIDWYAAASGGTVLAGGTGTATFSTSTAGTYYAEARNTTTGCSSPTRTAVVYTQTTAPAAPAVTTPVAFCENAIATALSASITPATSNTLNWYTVATGGTPSSTAPTPATTTATTLSYYVSQVDAINSCESNRALITVNINATPAAPTTSAAGPYCENATASALSATATGANTLNWYTVATGGTGSGTAITPATTPAGTTLYYVSQTAAYTLPTITCESARASISVLVNPNITASVNNSATTTSLCTGGNIDFTATPTNGGATPSYQWQVNGANVGTDSPTYTLTPSLFSDNGGDVAYSGTLSNGMNGGSGFGAWSITAGGSTGTFIGDPANDGNSNAGMGANSFGFYATGSNYVNALRTINGGMQVGDTLSFYWIFNWDANGGNKGFDLKNGGTTVFNINNGGFSGTITSTAGTVNTSYGTTPMLVTLVRSSSTQYAFSMTSRSGGATYTNTITNSTSIDGINFYIGNQNDGSGNRNMYVNNLIMKKYYEVVVNMTPSAQTCLTSSSATPSNTIVLGYAPSTPSVSIVAGASTTICPGASLSFSVSSSANLGSTPSYQWQINGTDVTGETNATFSTTALVNGDAVGLVVTSSISGGCLTSTTATSNTVSVTVQTPTSFSTQPTDAAACLGATQVFSATATGTGTISYQWYKSNTSITGNPTAITNSLTLSGLVSGSAADYYVVATGTCGSKNSDTITLTLNPNTLITTQPTAISLCAGLDTAFSVAATGFGTLTYQWRKNGSAISGETNDTLILSSVLAANAGTYSVLVTGGCNSLASSNAALTVNQLVNFVTQPSATPSVCAGATANLSSSVTGAGTLTYQWQLDGVDIAGANASTLAVTNAQLVNDGIYTLIATSSLCGADTSSTSDLTVNPVTAITTQPTDVTLCNGADALLNVVTAGIGTINYQWKYNGSNIVGETNDTLIVNNVTNTTNGGSYSVVVSGGTCSSGTINSTTVSVNIQSTTNAIAGSQTASCIVKGGDWIHFYTNDGKLIVSINPNGNDLGNVTATSYVDASPIIAYACNTDVNPNYASAVLGRRWVITPEHNLPAIIRLPFDNSEFTSLAAQSLTTANGADDIFAISDIQLSKYSGLYENGDWQDNCTAGAGTTLNINQSANGDVTVANGFVGTLANTSFAEFSIPGFSEFWLLNSGEPSALPVEMVSFAASCNDKEVEVKWTTASEHNSQNFIIETSRDLSNWITVGQVNAAGNSNQNIDYTIIDGNPISGVSYYRMLQVDLNGVERIYGPISVSCSDAENSMIVFPNPTKGNFTVEISSDENISNAQIQITDLTGKVINERSANILEGKSQFTFEGLDLQLGTYIINLNTGNGKINPVRVVVN
jgi:hypothetical protein